MRYHIRIPVRSRSATFHWLHVLLCHAGISLFPGQTLFPGLRCPRRQGRTHSIASARLSRGAAVLPCHNGNPPRPGCLCGVSASTCPSRCIPPSAGRPGIPAGCLFRHISGVCGSRQSPPLLSRALWHHSVLSVRLPSDLSPACSVQVRHSGSLRCCLGCQIPVLSFSPHRKTVL